MHAKATRAVQVLVTVTAGISLLLALAAFGAGNAEAAQVTLAWDPNPPAENVVAYRVWECPKGATQGCTKLAETPTTQQILEVAYGTHCWRATAMNAAGLESDYSMEVCVDFNKPSPVNTFRMIVYVPAK